jgi:hypothetical protein
VSAKASEDINSKAAIATIIFITSAPSRVSAPQPHREAARVFGQRYHTPLPRDSPPGNPDDLRASLLLNGPSLSQQSHRSPLTRAAKQQRISQGRALNDLTPPLVVPRKLRANCKVRTALNQ